MKNKLPIAATAILTAGVFACGIGTGLPSADAGETKDMGDGAVYSYYEFEYEGVQKLFTISCDPASAESGYEFVLHHVSSASGGYTLSTVAAIAEDYEAQTGRKVLAATNGDFFMGSGSSAGPVESYVKDGVVLSKGAYAWKHCFGFDNQGNFAIGRMTETVERLSVTTADGSENKVFEISAFNSEPAEGELAVYTTTGTYTVNGAAKYVIVASSSNTTTYPVYGTSRRTAEGTVISDGSFTVSSGQYAIVVKGDNEISRWLYENLWYGASADILRYPAGDFAGMEYVVGGWDILIENGTVNTSCRTDTENAGGVAAPRTFFGYKEDGTMLLCALDGRQSGYAIGLTVQQEAYLAQALGLVTAIELDGGGSTTFLLREDDGLTLLNSPSDGSMRSVCTAVLLVEKETAEEEETGGGTDEPDEEDDPADTETDGDTSGKKGCGSSLAVGGVACVAAVSGTAAAVCRKKKKGGKL